MNFRPGRKPQKSKRNHGKARCNTCRRETELAFSAMAADNAKMVVIDIYSYVWYGNAEHGSFNDGCSSKIASVLRRPLYAIRSSLDFAPSLMFRMLAVEWDPRRVTISSSSTFVAANTLSDSAQRMRLKSRQLPPASVGGISVAQAFTRSLAQPCKQNSVWSSMTSDRIRPCHSLLPGQTPATVGSTRLR